MSSYHVERDGRLVMPLARIALEFGISQERLEAFVDGYAESHESSESNTDNDGKEQI